MINVEHLEGEKDSILCVHGAMLSSWSFKKFMKYFSKKDYDVWALDLRGHGKSEDIKDYSSFHMKDYLKDIDYAVNKIGKKVILVGHSMGGLLSILYAHKHPENVKKLVLISTPYKHPPFSISMLLVNLLVMPLLFFKKKMKTNTKIMFSHDKADDKIISSTKEHSYEEPTKALIDSSNLSEPSEKVKELNIPICLVRGSKDYATSKELYDEFLKNLKNENKELLEFEGYGHLLIQEKGNNKIFSEILNWIEKS